ncbi:hypothetical protein [Salinimicrobium flavum]|uniref:Uncharacterized protein n=1 Tax=Salinimicrobium flavum TaxID=1737065 RepID=A0ABW5IVA8_9FLAO
MDNFEILRKKLEAFIKRFYVNELLKGLIFFVAIGLLYFLVTLFIEYLFWLDSRGRTLLFWSFVLVETFLFLRFIIYPLLKLFKLSRGIDYTQASIIIGKHFPEVNDKLLNVLQLKSSRHQTELLLAGIDQKSRELKPVPFSMAVDFRKNLPYLKYAAIPIIIILLILISGRTEIFSSSYERVVNYKVAYEAPAPFTFLLGNDSLKIRENEVLELEIFTEGKIIPEQASIHYGGQSYYLNQISPGLFRYRFEPLTGSFNFTLSGNKVVSREYKVEVIKVPRLTNLQMQLYFPKHTGMRDEVIEGTGNATIPEGTKVNWNMETNATDEVKLVSKDTTEIFRKEGNTFSAQKQLRNSLNYQISTSNREVVNYENLSFYLKVVKDEYPRLTLEHKKDTLEGETHYFSGKATDDHGISRVRLVVEPTETSNEKIIRNLDVGTGTVAEFLSVFPDTLELEKGKFYQFYFEVFDNDALNGYKRVKSNTFTYRRNTDDEEREQRLEQQKDALNTLDGSLKEMKLSEKELLEFSRLNKERSELNFNERKKLENFLKRQKDQNEIMKSYSEKLEETLEKEEESFNEDLKKDLEEKLKQRQEELKKNEELLEELEKYSQKIQEEGLSEKLEELSKNAKQSERSLEQLLELTRKYYVQEKLQKLASEMEQLGEDQEELSNAEEEKNTPTAQDSLQQETEEVLGDLKELGKENKGLKTPVDLGRDEKKEQEIQQDQNKALEELEQGNKKEAKKEQKKAADKMKQMAAKMKKQMQMGEMEQMQEDADMLRQILDNLITFSFEQEDLMEVFKKSGRNSPSFSGNLKRQNVLRENFHHIDDSLYALSLRNPMISEVITKRLIDVDYDLDKSLERLAQNEIPQGLASQQYVITGVNDLAYFLSDALNRMEQMLNQASGAGKGGSGQGMQLPDIIQKQGELKEKLGEGMKEGQKEGKGLKGNEGGNGEDENQSEKLFEIYKEQQMLRRALEEYLKKNGERPGGNKLQKEMEQIEKEILEKGFNNRTREKMEQLEHKLMELEEAEMEQGQRPERESETGKETPNNRSNQQILKAKEYFPATEILNRQTLPLRQIYKQKVKEYFERGDD